MTSFEAIRLIRRGCFEGALTAFTWSSRSPPSSCAAFAVPSWPVCPLVLGVLWALRLMDVLDLRFNMANVWAVPLIIGIAAEFRLNIYVRFMEARDTRRTRSRARSTVMGVVLSGLATHGRLRQPDDRAPPGHLRPGDVA